MTSSASPRYDGIVSLVFVVVIGLAIVFLIDANPNTLRARLGGDLPVIPIAWVLIASLVVITSAGADLLVRSHPEMQTRMLPTLNLGFTKIEFAPGFWILPSFSIIGSFAFFRLFNASLPGIAFAIALAAAGGLLLIVLVAQYYALSRDADMAQIGRLVLQAITYFLAFGSFSAVYYTGFRTLYSAALIGAAGMLLAYEILQWTSRKQWLLLSFLVGLALGEANWALNYWPTTFLLGGILLLVLFYVAVNILSHYTLGSLRRAILVEYGVIGVLGLVVVTLASALA